MNLTMMGLDPGPLVHALFHVALENPLVVLEIRCWCQWRRLWQFFPTGIESIGEAVPLFVFVPRGVDSKSG